MTKIIVDGKELEADPAKPLIAACHAHEVDVPMYCYHPGLSPVGSCRICQVEVRQGEQPARVVVACRTPVAEGMVVDTRAPKAIETRRECLEFLLKNHPLDCPICDKAGECDLQDYAFYYGQSKGRSLEPRRKLDKRKSLGDVIVLDEERCILCSRCVRFMEEVPKTPQLTVANLGARSVIATFPGPEGERPLTGNYQGNLADVCPVGALTLKAFRFEARVWNLTKSPSTCAECSRGCSITAEVLRGKQLKRFRPRPNPAVNQYWMCDVGRFAFEHVNAAERLGAALLRGFGGLEPAELEVALENAAERLRLYPGAFVLVSPFLTQEEAAALTLLARALGAELHFVSPPANGLADELLHTGDPCPNRRGLVEAGFTALAAEEALAKLAAAPVALLVGERVAELLGREALARATSAQRAVLFDAYPCDAAAIDVAIGVPVHVEKQGHWVNVDGQLGRLSAARPAPPGVAPLTRSLARLTELVQATEARR